MFEIPVNIRTLSAKSFHEEYKDVLTNIVAAPPISGMSMREFEYRIFSNEDWQSILLPDRIMNIDRGDPEEARDNAFLESDWYRPVNWMEVILSAHWSRPVGTVIHADSRLLRSENQDPPGDTFADVIPATARMVSEHLHSCTRVRERDMLIDPAGEWATLDENDHDFCILGANGELFDRFVAAFGGLQAIKSRFEYWLRVRATPGFPHTSSKDDNLDEEFLGPFRPIYAHIHWPWPFPDHIGKETQSD